MIAHKNVGRVARTNVFEVMFRMDDDEDEDDDDDDDDDEDDDGDDDDDDDDTDLLLLGAQKILRICCTPSVECL